MDFVHIPARRHALGWRFTEELPAQALDAIATVSPLDELLARFSPARDVALGGFTIATTTIPLADLVDDLDELARLGTLEAVCARVDARLSGDGLRLPTEDELEAAAGGSLFAWGMTIPDGVPHGSETTFAGHRVPNDAGLFLNHDPYRMELCCHALKLGDGGAAICGGEPWPMAWLALSPSFRQLDADILECFPESLESALVRPVQLGR